MTDFSSLEYWEKRYNENGDIFEWYQVYENLKEKIGEFFKPESKILHIGCGTSRFAEDLYIEEIKDVVNIDYSETAIKIMDERYKTENNEDFHLTFKKMDLNDLSEFTENEFDIIFDKACLDSLLCGENALPLVDKILRELHRVLKVGGVYIIVSNGSEENRKNLFDETLWEYRMELIEKPSKMIVLNEKDPKNYHYIYILTKKEIEKKEEEKVEEQPQEEKKEETPSPATAATKPKIKASTKTKV